MVPPRGSQPGRPTRAAGRPTRLPRAPQPLLPLARRALRRPPRRLQQPPEQQSRPRAGPSRHSASLRSLSRCFIALQPHSSRLALGSLAPLPAPALPPDAFSRGPDPREEATQPSRNGANIATPGRATAGESPPPGAARGQSAGGAARAQPPACSPPPTPSRSRSAVPRGSSAGRATWCGPEGPLDFIPRPVTPNTHASCAAGVQIGGSILLLVVTSMQKKRKKSSDCLEIQPRGRKNGGEKVKAYMGSSSQTQRNVLSV
ncbi:uncharacterized protein LOC144222683 isoform X1 [Crocuta crocuta]